MQCRGVNKTLTWTCDVNMTALELETSQSSEIETLIDVNSLIGEECEQQEPELGTLVGTAFVARDMMQIVDALSEDGMLRYVGK